MVFRKKGTKPKPISAIELLLHNRIKRWEYNQTYYDKNRLRIIEKYHKNKKLKNIPKNK